MTSLHCENNIITDRLLRIWFQLVKGWNLASRRTRIAFTLCVSSALTYTIAIGSPYWQHVTNEIGTAHSGLWTVCILERCDQFANHSVHGWFHFVQAAMVMGYITQIFTIVFYLLGGLLKTKSRRKKIIYYATLIGSFMMWTCTMSAVIVYGLDQGHDPTSLSWGFNLAVITTILQLLGTFVLVSQLKYKEKYTKNIQELELLKYPDHLTPSHLQEMFQPDHSTDLQLQEITQARNSKISEPLTNEVRLRGNTIIGSEMANCSSSSSNLLIKELYKSNDLPKRKRPLVRHNSSSAEIQCHLTSPFSDGPTAHTVQSHTDTNMEFYQATNDGHGNNQLLQDAPTNFPHNSSLSSSFSGSAHIASTFNEVVDLSSSLNSTGLRERTGSVLDPFYN